jgi:hypothetical protein
MAASLMEIGYCPRTLVAINKLMSPLTMALLNAMTIASNCAKPDPHIMRNWTAIMSIKAVFEFLFLWASRFFSTILLMGTSYFLNRVTNLMKIRSKVGINNWKIKTMPMIIAKRMDIKMKKKSRGI